MQVEEKSQENENTEQTDSNPASVITVEEYAALTTPSEEVPDELEWPDLPPAPDKLPPEYDEDYVEPEETKEAEKEEEEEAFVPPD